MQYDIETGTLFRGNVPNCNNTHSSIQERKISENFKLSIHFIFLGVWLEKGTQHGTVDTICSNIQK
jgi:hypothetical protein